MAGEQRPRGDMQARILSYIEEVIETRGYPPSVREIGEAVGLRSTSTVHGHLTRLERKGLLHRDAMKPRAMGLSKSASYSETIDDSRVRQLPVVGRVAAGQPILAEESIDEQMVLPVDLVGEGEHFILRVRGDSMIQAGIFNDDYIVVRRQPDAHNGEIVVALVGDDATVKRFYKENGHFRLQPENDAMEPIIVPSVEILGKVVSLLRKF
ncbi:MAG: transcriptional repressor LexA [Candidatus Ventricola sp.]